MNTQDYTTTIEVSQTPQQVFDAINNVCNWWSLNIKGNTQHLHDEFSYNYKDVHKCKMKIVESVPAKKVVWQVLDNYFSFTQDKNEWRGTYIIFNIQQQNGSTQLQFTHQGLVPSYECYNACVNGWNQYIQQSLPQLIATGKGQPNSKETAYTIHEVAARFTELAQQEKWFDIQDELFAEDVQSIEPMHATHLHNASGKVAVRKKGEDWVKRVEAVHKSFTSQPIVTANFFAVARELDITVQGLGRMLVSEIMMYKVEDSKITSEQFFY